MVHRLQKRRGRRAHGWIVPVSAALILFLTGLFLLLRGRDTTFPIGRDAVLETVDRRVAALSHETLSLYTLRGLKTFEAPVAGAQALAAGQGVGAAYAQNDVYLFMPSGRVTAHIVSDVPVRRVCCGASVTAVVTQDASGECRATIYDCYANAIDSVVQSDLLPHDRFVDAGMYEGTLWLLTVDSSGAQPISRIYLFNVQNRTLLARIDVPDQLVMAVAADEKNVFAIGTQQIMCYNYNGIRLWQSAANDLQMRRACVSHGDAALLFSLDGAQGYKLLFDRRERKFFREAASVCMDEEYVYFLQGDTLMRCGVAEEENVTTKRLEKTYSAILPVSGRRVLLFDGAQWIGRVI